MSTLTVAQAADALSQAGWPATLIPIMVGIGKAESGLRVDATSRPNSNGTIDHGWLQINSVHSQYSVAQLLTDPVYTAKAALDIYHAQGLQAWSTYNSGAYKVGGLPDVGSTSGSPSSSTSGTVEQAGLLGLTNPFSNPFADVPAKVGAAVQPVAYRLLVLAGAAGLVMAGLWRASKPARKHASHALEQAQQAQQAGDAPQTAAAPAGKSGAAAGESAAALPAEAAVVAV